MSAWLFPLEDSFEAAARWQTSSSACCIREASTSPRPRLDGESSALGGPEPTKAHEPTRPMNPFRRPRLLPVEAANEEECRSLRAGLQGHRGARAARLRRDGTLAADGACACVRRERRLPAVHRGVRPLLLLQLVG